MRQFYNLREQTIDVTEKEKMDEIEAFMTKYHLRFTKSSSELKFRPTWQFFVILTVANTILGLIHKENIGQLLDGYALIFVLYGAMWLNAKYQTKMYHELNVKVN